MGLDIKSAEGDGLLLEIKNNVVVMSGSTKTSNPGVIIEPFLNELHVKLLEKEIKSINVDIRKLDFLNSSGIKELVCWITKLENLPDNTRYNIKFIYDPEIRWQETLVSSMVYLNIDFVTKDIAI